MRELKHQVDVCVVGGGLAGLCAAVAAARRGARVALMHDRPVLGGNASSEIRMWVCGAKGRDARETGIIEEILLENLYRNAQGNWSMWDAILYETVRFESNITLLLNCSCNGAVMATVGGADPPLRIQSIRGWQLTTQTWHDVTADLFVDCSGDSILAPLSGADFRWGREAREEFGESIAPETADSKTMGMSCLLQARETARPQPFIPPAWAHTFAGEDDLAERPHDIGSWATNFWWIEIGGEGDTIHDSEACRDELLKIVFGVWDHVKNQGDHGAENWALDWIGFLPGKRESRRYVGDHILTQQEVMSGGVFEDAVAYGGWPLDDHFPGGFYHKGGRPNTFELPPRPYGIPFRSLYSRNVENLLFAGRNISASHAAISSSRVMATCALLGQAAGTAAALAVGEGLLPRDVAAQCATALQQALMDDDGYIPGLRREVSALSRAAILSAAEGDPEPLRNGIDRAVGDEDNGWTAQPGAWVEYDLGKRVLIREVRLVFDSDLGRRGLNLPCSYPLDAQPAAFPATMVAAFRVETRDADGSRRVVFRTEKNCQRLVKVALDIETDAVRFVPESTRGADRAHVFAFEVR